ncbi:hypothetical protein L4X63_06480 [Geomonas sp. Red32]|uniref:hypothetical protein n=1 Tax=Geomonas sp. Red32 TaxID=2912856 RepID=UPI00202CE400|nr:hypothetical protein [Geomonas sp. Red32]MCM0081230.1 hypothetical protein [Geomonas sp. Red32]
MKKIALLLFAALLSLPMAASAAEAGSVQGKNPCLLGSEKCPAGQAYTIQEIITGLQAELNKGGKVYTREELVTLQAKLDDYQHLLVSMTTN